MGNDSELRPGMFSNPGKQKKTKPASKGKGKGTARKSYSLDAETIEGLERIVANLREQGICTDKNREMTEHYLVITLLAQDVQDILARRRKVTLTSASAKNVEVEITE